jgi:hypothetical protein
METIIATDPLIASALMFGRRRNQAGVLIEPIPDRVFDPNQASDLARFRNEIW